MFDFENGIQSEIGDHSLLDAAIWLPPEGESIRNPFRRGAKIHDLPDLKARAAQDSGNPVAHRTYKKYFQVINVIDEWMKTHRAIVYVNDLTRGDILDLLKTLDNSHRRITTCNSIKRDLKSMLRAAGREDLGALVKQKKEPRRNKAMSDDNLARLLAVASIRDSAMLLFLRHTGVRRQTIPRVTLSNLLMWVNDQNEQMLAYKNIVEKGGTPRGVYVKNENLCNAIKLWLGVRAAKHNPDYLFTSHYTRPAHQPRNRWQDLSAAARKSELAERCQHQPPRAAAPQSPKKC